MWANGLTMFSDVRAHIERDTPALTLHYQDLLGRVLET